jgi:hypothetical protein
MDRYVLCFIFCGFLVGCSGSDDDSVDGDWEDESPTGTFLDPREGAGESGYEALDETCELVDSPTYLERFKTPMFRDAVLTDQVALLVDGSMLWAISLQDPSRPERLSLTRLPGHPKSVALHSSGVLLVAAGEAGLLSIELNDLENPETIGTSELPEIALDVAVSGDIAYVAMGRGGLAILDVSVPAAPMLLAQLPVLDFAVAVDVEGSMVYVAACRSVCVVDATVPETPVTLGTFWVPEGHAKELDVVGSELFVAGGEALFALNVENPSAVRWTGYYEDPSVEGFYVNAVAVQSGVAYIAAGDESVRSVDVSNLAGGAKATNLVARDEDDEEDEGPKLSGPQKKPPPSTETVEIEKGDPINVVLAGDLLLVLGNFRWVGERLLRVMEILPAGKMVDVGTYVQPNNTLGVDPFEDSWVLHGADGQESVISWDGEEIAGFEIAGKNENVVVQATQALGWFFMRLESGKLHRWTWGDEERSELIPMFPIYSITAGDNLGYAAEPASNSIRQINLETGVQTWEAYGEGSFLGYSHILSHKQTIYAYDWVMGELSVFAQGDGGFANDLGVLNVGLCEMYDLADHFSGMRATRSILSPAGERVALLCPHDDEGKSSVIYIGLSKTGEPKVEEVRALPGGYWADMEIVGNEILAVAFDNNAYQTTLHLQGPEESSSFQWNGHGNGLTVNGAEVLVVDGDLGLKRFELSQAGIVEIIETPGGTQ